LEDAVIDEKHMVYYIGVGRTFSSGPLGPGDFSKIFLRGTMVIFSFTHWKLRKEPFFAKIFKIQPCPRFRRPWLIISGGS